MTNKEILEYVSKQLSAGTPKDTISQNLMANGWDQNDINEAFAQIESQDQPQPSQEQVSLAQNTNIQLANSVSANKTNRTLVVSIVVIVLLIIVGGVWWFLSSSKKDITEDTLELNQVADTKETETEVEKSDTDKVLSKWENMELDEFPKLIKRDNSNVDVMSLWKNRELVSYNLEYEAYNDGGHIVDKEKSSGNIEYRNREGESDNFYSERYYYPYISNEKNWNKARGTISVKMNTSPFLDSENDINVTSFESCTSRGCLDTLSMLEDSLLLSSGELVLTPLFYQFMNKISDLNSQIKYVGTYDTLGVKSLCFNSSADQDYLGLLSHYSNDTICYHPEYDIPLLIITYDRDEKSNAVNGVKIATDLEIK